MIESILVYTKNDDNNYDVIQENYQEITRENNGSRLIKRIDKKIIATFSSHIEAEAFIRAEKNMIFKMECELALQDEYENNCEKEPGWTACP